MPICTPMLLNSSATGRSIAPAASSHSLPPLATEQDHQARLRASTLVQNGIMTAAASSAARRGPLVAIR